MIKEVEMDALVFDTDEHGHTILREEKRIEKNYPECRKTCQTDEFWRRRHGVTL